MRNAAPPRADEALDLGRGHHQGGRLDEAEVLYREALHAAPENSEALHLLGLILHQRGDHAGAAEFIASAIRGTPAAPHYHNNLGTVLAALGRPGDAADAFRRAVALAPGYAEAFYNLGNALRRLDRPAEAEAAYRRALALRPGDGAALNNLATLYSDLGRAEDAIDAFRAAAISAPGDADIHRNLIKTYLGAGRAGAAVDVYRDLAARHPENADVRAHLGTCLLLTGQLGEGFREYEWRRKTGLYAEDRHAQPEWRGEPLDGRTILLHAEQGLGDLIHFARYVPLVAARGGRVLLECYAPLVRLFANLDGVAGLVTTGDVVPPIDCRAHLASLPRIFATDLDSIPNQIPYLAPPAADAATWRERIKAPGVKVGLVWSGGAEHPNDAQRSCPLPALAPLFDVPGVDFFSLQVGPRAGDARAAGMDGRITDLAPFIGDFADTAAAIAELDLVISVDTAPAHLAGALGGAVWILLAAVPDWRWMLGRDDSPWYPTARLFRQQAAGDWAVVVARVRADLAQLAARRA